MSHRQIDPLKYCIFNVYAHICINAVLNTNSIASYIQHCWHFFLLMVVFHSGINTYVHALHLLNHVQKEVSLPLSRHPYVSLFSCFVCALIHACMHVCARTHTGTVSHTTSGIRQVET